MKELRMRLTTADFLGPPTLPERWDPELLVQTIHELGAWLGYERVRIDRQWFPNERGQRDYTPYFEAGYGVGTVKVRASWGGVWEATKENYRPDKGPALIELLMQGVPADA
jgi:hypothetical protein